jgi:hypothetical protein
MPIHRADWVTTRNHRKAGLHGFVTRMARDGSWADVRWRYAGDEWRKRMPADSLVALHTIPLGSGWEVTDLTRQREIETEEPHATDAQ